jgi:hypothetical protein
MKQGLGVKYRRIAMSKIAKDWSFLVVVALTAFSILGFMVCAMVFVLSPHKFDVFTPASPFVCGLFLSEAALMMLTILFHKKSGRAAMLLGVYFGIAMSVAAAGPTYFIVGMHFWHH